MNSTRQLVLGIIFMILGIVGFIISGIKMHNDPFWIVACFVSIVTTVDGVILIDNLEGERKR